jgi:hypothetical protein
MASRHGPYGKNPTFFVMLPSDHEQRRIFFMLQKLSLITAWWWA